MNAQKLDQIIAKYIEKFVILNDETDGEIYKWRIVAQFKPAMDEALAAQADGLYEKLLDIRKLTSNLIDNGKELHLRALCDYAKEDPVKVCEILQNLFSDDGGDLKQRQHRIFKFLEECAELKVKYAPENWRYEISLKTAIVLLFLYDPEHNYMYKATQAYAFADHVGFIDDWGAGSTYRLDIYYKMCDELVAYIKQHTALINTNASRYEDNNELYSDPEYHLLASDVIYCCSVYNLLDGIAPEHATTVERKLARARREKAEELYNQLVLAQENNELFNQAKQYVFQTLRPGTLVQHRDKNYGTGTIEKVGNLVWGNSVFICVSIYFQSKEKTLQFMLKSLTDGTIRVADTEIMCRIMEYSPILLDEQIIAKKLKDAEDRFNLYKEYLF